MTQGSTSSEFFIGLLVWASTSGLQWLAKWSLRYFEHKYGTARQILVGFVLVTALVGNIVLYHYAGKLFLLFSSLLFAAAFWILWLQLRQFWRIGLIGADRTIKEGIDYRRSLNMCQNSLSFLGVGAGKLTDLKQEFEGAMQRCHRPSRPIRFLLCRPDNEGLRQSAQSAGKPPAEYESRVRDSLRLIASLRARRNWNIEVRFYSPSLPLFRLMFIDNWLCLASHYVFGEGDGADWPQLHVRRRDEDRDVKLLYHPFQEYFERLWQESVPWEVDEFSEEA